MPELFAPSGCLHANQKVPCGLAEAVTRISDGHTPDDAFDEVRKHFSEKELVDLTLAIVAINGWNGLATAYRAVPGGYLAQQTR